MYLIDFFRVVPKKRNIKIRRKKGIILNNPKKIYHIVFYISNVVIISCLFFLIWLYRPIIDVWFKYKEATNTTNIDFVNEVVVEEKKNDYLYKGFYIEIPKILAEAKIISNIDPNDKDTINKVLKNGSVGLKVGSKTPDKEFGTMFLFAHSTEMSMFKKKENAVFYLLDELKSGDFINIYFGGEKYVYTIYDKKVVSSKDVQYLNYEEEKEKLVILQTCWPIGTNWKRLLVFAKRI